MKRQLVRMSPLAALAALFLLGTAPAQRVSQEDRISALESKIAGIEAGQQSALNRLDQMRLNLDNSMEPLRVRLADYGEDVRGMESRLVALEEQLALMNESLIEIAAGFATGSTPAAQTTASNSPMPPPQRPSSVPGPAVARPSRTATPEPEAPRSEADSLYSASYTDYLAAAYPLAISGFEEYLRLFPDADNADNAQYWIGESYFSEQQYQLARTAFLELTRRYPGGETVPDAKFKAARCLVELGDGARAVDELVQLVRDHPGAETTPVACMQIERLGAERPAVCPEG